jgi:GT2 family glycosyltransferase
MASQRWSMTGSLPAVSVVMPVHNAAPFLHDSVRSVLDQSFPDFELVVLENGSSDGSASILRSYASSDPRIRLIEDPRRLGLVESSNHVVGKATAPLLARMDADDVCHPERLARQFELMRRHPEVVAVGTLSDGIDADGRRVRPRDRWRLIRCSQVPFSHGSSMFRRDAFDRIGGYREGLLWRDVDLFLRLTGEGVVLVLPEALYSYRYNASSNSLSYTPAEIARSTDLLLRCLAERRAGRRHEGLTEASPGEPIRPDSFAAALHLQGALRLWAGESPRVLRDLIGTGIQLDPAWLRTLAWAMWGALSPGTLRTVLRAFVKIKDALAGARIKDGRAYRWRLG